jgi:prepilin-type N-terminal cleavage/methylation domain-containing protein
MEKKIYKNFFKYSGFTIIELMVTLAIMVSLFTVIITGLAGQRSNRNLQIAVNELVTNLRKLQTNVLVSKGISSSLPAQYYILKIDSTKPNQYTMQAVYNTDVSPTLTDLETVKLPLGVKISGSSPLYVYRTGYNTSPTCALVGFKAPFAKVLISSSCTPNSPTVPYTIINGDDYYSLINFITNGATTANSDTSLDIVLSNDTNTKSQTVTVKGISGLITSQ